MANSGPSFFLDRARLLEQARRLAPEYAAAKPHPHLVLDGLFGGAVARALAADFPRREDARWKYRDYPEQRRYGQLQQRGFIEVAPSLRHALAELNGLAFLDFLEEATGIPGLIPDPHFVGGGLHLTPPGGFLAVHADFNRDSRRGLKRALSAIVYLNPEWGTDWGGELELWDAKAQACQVKIAPLLDRLVVMAYGEENFHGQPSPLACPPDRFRASLASYYYVAEPASAGEPAHGAIWKSGSVAR